DIAGGTITRDAHRGTHKGIGNPEGNRINPSPQGKQRGRALASRRGTPKPISEGKPVNPHPRNQFSRVSIGKGKHSHPRPPPLACTRGFEASPMRTSRPPPRAGPTFTRGRVRRPLCASRW